MQIYIYEDQYAMDLDPLTSTRASFDIRIGAGTFFDQIQSQFPDAAISLFVRDELAKVTAERYPDCTVNPKSVTDGLWLLGNVIWNQDISELIQNENAVYYLNHKIVGANLLAKEGNGWLKKGGPVHTNPAGNNKMSVSATYCQYIWHILDQMPQSISSEAKNRGKPVTPSVFSNVSFINKGQVFVGDAVIQPTALINAEKGPVIIEDGATIHGQSYLEGPLYIGKDTMIKPLTQIKNSVIGPNCKIGGEVDTVMIQGYTNKVHDGHLGDAVLGEWVNLGAGTINSNLKNNYTEVSVQVNGKNVNTGSIHVGCFMGDHVKTAIGTVLNTGTLIGAGAMMATDGFPPKTIRPFTWYVNGRHRKVLLDKFLETAYHVKKRRGKSLSIAEKSLLKYLQNER